MKRRLMIAGLALVAALPLAAQGRMGRGAMAGDGPNRIEFLAGYLGLSESQKTQADAIFAAARQSSETARGQMTSAREALQAAVKSGQSDAELDRLAAAVGTIQGQLAGIQAKAQSKFYALLTAEQKQKYDAAGNRRRGGQ
jgi:Spy/CpxP family protein refolding chaperone